MSAYLLWLRALTIVSFALFAERALGAAGAPCRYQENVAQTCGNLACIPANSAQPHQGDPGTCGNCGPAGVDDVGAEQCGGIACRADGTCEVSSVVSPAPVPVWPTFHLLVIDASTTLADASGYSGKPIVGAGYLFQGGLARTDPTPLPDGGWTTRVPVLYFDAGAVAAFAGNAQNLFLRLGLAAHVPSWPLGITTFGLDATYQRAGSAIWKLDTTRNVDRLGPALSIGFLYNLFISGGYLWALNHDSPQSHGAVLLSLTYMRDLTNDLVPDQFQKYIPEKLRGPER